MMPANRIFKTGKAGRGGWSLLCRLNQLVYGLWLVERLADREARAHAPIELAGFEQLVMAAFCGDLTAVEHEDAVGVAYGRQPVRDDECRSAGAKPSERGKHNLFRDGVEGQIGRASCRERV